MPVKLKKLLMITRLFYTTTHTPQRTIHRRQNTRRLQKRWRPSQIVSPDKDGSQLTGQSGTNCTVCLFDATTKKTLNKHLTYNGYLYFSRCGFNYLFLDFFFPSEVSKERKFWLWAFTCMYNYEYTRLTAGGGLIESFAAFDSLAWNLLKNLLDTKNW